MRTVILCVLSAPYIARLCSGEKWYDESMADRETRGESGQGAEGTSSSGRERER